MPQRYKKSPMYGRAKQREAAQRAGGNYAVAQSGYTQVDQAYDVADMQRKIQLKSMGMQKEQFDKSLKESQRQFDSSMDERKRQFGIQLGAAHEKLKYQRKQNRKAEFLGLFNIALGIGSGLIDHINKSKLLRQQQMYDQLLQSRIDKISSGAGG